MNTWGDNIRESDLRGRTTYWKLAGVIIVTLGIVGAVIMTRPERLEVEETSRGEVVYSNFAPVRHFIQPAASIDPSKLVASLEGIGIEESDINLALLRDGQSLAASTGADRKDAVDALSIRIVLAGQAVRLNMHQDELFKAELRRFYIDRLAGRFLQEKLAKEVDVTASQVRRFIEDNPQLFEGRRYYTFDTLAIPTSAVSKLDKELVNSSLNLDEVTDSLSNLEIPYRRLPFTSYSEELPEGLLEKLPDLEKTGAPFYLRNGDRTNIAVILASQSVPIEPAKRFELARERLLATRKAEALRKYEAEVLELSKPSYERNYDGR